MHRRQFIAGTTAAATVALLPGAAFALLGASGQALAEHHTALDALGITDLHAQLCEAPSPAAALDLLEHALLARLRGTIDPVIAHAVGRLDAGAAVADVVHEVGYSHRHFAALFRAHVGLAPKRYARVRRVLRAVEQARAGRELAAIASATGFADQAQFSRNYRSRFGCTPSEARATSRAANA